MRGVAWIVLSLALIACPKELTLHTTGEESETSGTSGTSTGPAVPTTSISPPTGETSSGGGSTEVDPTTSGTTSGSSGEAGSSSSGAGSTTGEATDETTGVEGSTTGSLGQPFDCYGCLCDAEASYCQQVFGGLTGRAGVPLPRRPCPEVEPDSLGSGCVLFPAVCEGVPTCDCLSTMNGDCDCEEVERGVFEVICQLP